MCSVRIHSKRMREELKLRWDQASCISIISVRKAVKSAASGIWRRISNKKTAQGPRFRGRGAQPAGSHADWCVIHDPHLAVEHRAQPDLRHAQGFFWVARKDLLEVNF